MHLVQILFSIRPTIEIKEIQKRRKKPPSSLMAGTPHQPQPGSVPTQAGGFVHLALLEIAADTFVPLPKIEAHYKGDRKSKTLYIDSGFISININL